MKRREFLRKLKVELRKRRDIEIEEVLFYYDEMIQDAVDNGEKEEIFIANLGSISDIRRRIVDEEEFILKVKKQNVIGENALSKTVKIFGYIVVGFINFIAAIASISVFSSGVFIIGLALFRIVTNTPIDIYGYFAILGMALVGLSLIILGIAVVKWVFNESRSSLLSMYRKANDLINRRGE